MSPLLHVVLFQPEIPQNTGNVGRLCAYTGCRLHLIEPLGFTITDRHLRRSGIDYWNALDVLIHENWVEFLNSDGVPARLWLFTTQASQSHWGARFARGDGLVFGSESAGVPAWMHAQIGDELRVTIPRFTDGLRSLNLATSAGIGVYEALRQVAPSAGEGR